MPKTKDLTLILLLFLVLRPSSSAKIKIADNRELNYRPITRDELRHLILEDLYYEESEEMNSDLSLDSEQEEYYHPKIRMKLTKTKASWDSLLPQGPERTMVQAQCQGAQGQDNLPIFLR